MLKLSRRLDYAILAVAHLAASSDERLSARILAERTRVPPAILANILKELCRAGLVSSARGVQGGYQLAVEPAKLSVGALVRTLEGPTRLVECVVLPEDEVEQHSNSCQLEEQCPIKSPLRRVHERILEVLEETDFASLAAEILVTTPVPEPSTEAN